MGDRENPWTKLASTRCYEDGWITVEQDQVRHIRGDVTTYRRVHYKAVGATILPVDDSGHTYLVGQYRYPPDCYSWELPRGGADRSAPALEAAKRELREETGLRAERWLELLNVLPSPSITDEVAPCFVAWELSQGETQLDEHEVIEVRRVPFAEAVRMALGGGIMDAPSIATILAAFAKAIRSELPEDLAQRLRRGSSEDLPRSGHMTWGASADG